MATYRIRRGDTRPALAAVLSDQAGAVLDLTDATVELHFARGSLVLSRDAVVGADPTEGTVSYAWQAEDWGEGGLVVGTWRVEWEVTYTAGDVLTVPATGHDELVVEEDLA